MPLTLLIQVLLYVCQVTYDRLDILQLPHEWHLIKILLLEELDIFLFHIIDKRLDADILSCLL